MEPINLLIKPASSLCNLRCKYCFYFDVAACREIKSYGIMKTELLEAWRRHGGGRKPVVHCRERSPGAGAENAVRGYPTPFKAAPVTKECSIRC